MTGLTGIRRVLEEEHVHKMDDRISGGRIYPGVRIKIGVLNDTL